jgi:putative FmdB family regulatory protein
VPLYEFECTKCGHRFERLQRFSDPPPEACPTCGAAVHQLLSAPAIQFKGSGWYVTDYAKRSGSPAPTGGNGHGNGDKANGNGHGTETKSEPKPAAKTESKTGGAESK